MAGNQKTNNPKKIAFIGLGLYGFESACKLADEGHEVTIFEGCGSPGQGLTGTFGARSHDGPHYTRSLATRESCKKNFILFKQAHPELVVSTFAIYALGVQDADGLPPKVDAATFEAVCRESKGSCWSIGLDPFGKGQVQNAFLLDEPTLLVGKALRAVMKAGIADRNITVHYNLPVIALEKNTVITNDNAYIFDHIINATGYQALTPPSHEIPFDISIVYQPCLALRYEDTKPSNEHISMIFMDGWFPSIMPQLGNDDKHAYIVTHGKYTILGSFHTIQEANALLNIVFSDTTYIDDYAKPRTEKHFNELWPEFSKRFKYKGYVGKVVAKTNNDTEFRDTICFRDNKDIKHIIPGKVTGCMQAAREISSFVNHPENVITVNGYAYVKGGVLDQSLPEISKKPTNEKRSTCNLQPYEEYLQEKRLINPPIHPPIHPQNASVSRGLRFTNLINTPDGSKFPRPKL